MLIDNKGNVVIIITGAYQRDGNKIGLIMDIQKAIIFRCLNWKAIN